MAITLNDLSIRQDDFVLGADLEIPRGITAIIGPSGGGKSTLLLAIAGFVELAKGEIRFDGNIVSDLPPSERPASLLFQENNLFPHLTVFQNAALGVRPYKKLTVEQRESVSRSLSRVGLSGKANRLPSELSGGQRQRVALARALLRDRPVLMLDEPFAALGPALRQEMLDLVAEIQNEQDSVLLLVTHNPEDAARIANHTILVAEGRAHPPVRTSDLFANPPRLLADYLGK